MKYIYYKDDFKVTLEFKDGDTPTPLDNVDFRGKLYTAYDKYSEGIPFSRINGDVIGCDIGENGSLTIVADNHGFKAGKLMVDMKYYIYNDEYTDGTQTIARTYDLKTWLTTSQKLADGERPIEVNAIINLPLEVIVQQVKDLTEKGEQIVAEADTAIANVNTAIERANTAADSVEDAVTSANNAANKADTAANNVNTAIESTNSAAQRANIAADNASSAIEAANTATSKANAAAEEAKTSATTASQAAAQATTAAQAATSAATNANTAADNASQYADRYEDIANSLPIVTPDFEGAAQDTGLRYVIRKNKLIAILKDGHVEYAPEGIAYVDAIAPTSFSIGDKVYNVPAGITYVELGLTAPITGNDMDNKVLYKNAGIRGFGLYLDSSKNTRLGQTFAAAADLEWLDISGMDTKSVGYGFNICGKSTKLRKIYGKWQLPAAERADHAFNSCSALEEIDVSEAGMGKCKNINATFSGCSSLTSLDVSRWDTAAVTNMSRAFMDCSSLTSLDVSRWDTAACTTMQSTFSGCSSLTALDVSGWDTAAVTTMGYMFYNCTSLTSLDVSGWDTAACTNIEGLFYGCSSLTALDASKWDLAACPSTITMFAGCSSLTTLDVSAWDPAALINTGYMFTGCYALTTLRWPMMGKIKADATNNKSISLFNSPLDRASLDSIFAYDRTANGLTNPLTVQLSKTSKALLSAEEIAAITAKGYTIV